MTLFETLTAIKDENLDQRQLENYRDKLLMLASELELECGELKKKEAIFGLVKNEETESALKRKWKGSEDGIRLILVKSYIRAVSKACESLRQRIYSKL